MCNKLRKTLKFLNPNSKRYRKWYTRILFKIHFFILENGLDPWLLNKKNQTPFDLLDTHCTTYNQLFNLWSKQIFCKFLFNVNSTTTSTSSSIFDKLGNSFEESLIKKIIAYF